MLRVNKIVSAIILICFLLNIAVSDLAFGLATPSALTGIVGIQHKDMGRIKLALEEQLVALVRPNLPVNIGTFQTILKEQIFKEKTIFQPADMQFFFHETKLTNTGLCVMVRLKDKYGLRTYYATFSLQKDENGGFPIGVYTEDQYKGTAGFTKGIPQIKAEDAKAIERYVQHENGIDAIVRYAAEHGLIVKQNIDKDRFREIIKDILTALKIKSNNTKGLKSIEERNIFFIKETTEIGRMLKDNPATVIDEFGNEHKIIARAHSSNNSIYLFLDEREVDIYLPKKQRELTHFGGENGDLLAELSKVPTTHKFEMVWNGRRTHTPQLLLHEIGVILGLPIKRVSKIRGEASSKWGHYGWVINEIDKRLELAVFGEVTGEPNRETMGDELSLSIVDLDKNLTTRDYAAGKNRHTMPVPVSDAITNRAEVPQKIEFAARKSADSRGKPTVEVVLKVGELEVKGDVPAGASKGEDEAQTVDVDQAIKNINEVIAPMLSQSGLNLNNHADLIELEKRLIAASGDNFKTLGANATVPVSRALWKMAAKLHGMELYEYIQAYEPDAVDHNNPDIVRFYMNIYNGGLHALKNKEGEELGKDRIDIQEIMIVPVSNKTYREGLQMGDRIDAELKNILLKDYEANKITRADEAGFSVKGLGNSEQAIEYVFQAIEQAGYKVGVDVKLALDVAATSFYDKEKGTYKFQGKYLTSDEMVAFYVRLVQKYSEKIISIEDGLAENDWAGWNRLTEQMKKFGIYTIGDDIFVTQLPRLEKGIKEGSASAILIKVNQNGTIYGTLEVIKRAKQAGMKSVVSHRSGETMDSSIADLAFAVRALGLKTGDPQPDYDFGEGGQYEGKPLVRRVKYERAVEIEKRERAQLLSSQKKIIRGIQKVLEETRGRDDYFMKPTIVGNGANIKENDSIIFTNFRGDRAEPMDRCLTSDPDFKHFPLKQLNPIVAPFAVYSDKYFKASRQKGIITEPIYTNTLSEVLAKNGRTQVSIAESEKFKHVTYFFDGKREQKFTGVESVQIASNEIGEHWRMPKMKAQEIAEEAKKWISGEEGRDKKDFVLLNFANLDILGHFDRFDAIVDGALAVDEAVGIIRETVKKAGGVLIVTADHGSGEQKVKLDERGMPLLDQNGNVRPLKSHTFDNKVPFIIEGIGNNVKLKERGSLKNVAPTILELMGIKRPGEMTAESLLENYTGGPVKGPVVMIVRDGWGLPKFANTEALKWNAVEQARLRCEAAGKKFNDTELTNQNSNTELLAHGKAVGLPDYQMGDSENGHLNLGAGRDVESPLLILDEMLKTEEFAKNEIFRKALDNAKNGHTLHIIGMLSEGGVHSHIEHLFKLLNIIAKQRAGLEKIVIHPIFDGRDVETSEKAGWQSLEELFHKINELGLQDITDIGVIAGRYYPMDRDALNRDKKGKPSTDLWEERVKPWYDAIVHNEGPRLEDIAPVATAAPSAVSTTGQQKIDTMISLVSESVLEIRQQIPTHPNERYNLLITSEFFANGELEEHRAKYGDRFDVDRISGRAPEQFVDNILAKAAGKETKTIALVPNDLPAEQLEKLTKVGIRFVRVNTTDLQKAKADRDASREKFQIDTYATMLLLRRIDNSITTDSSIYKLLSFYLKSHFSLTDRIAIDDYIMAIINNDVARLIKGCLSYRPVQPYETPNYNNVAASLISA